MKYTLSSITLALLLLIIGTSCDNKLSKGKKLFVSVNTFKQNGKLIVWGRNYAGKDVNIKFTLFNQKYYKEFTEVKLPANNTYSIGMKNTWICNYGDIISMIVDGRSYEFKIDLHGGIHKNISKKSILPSKSNLQDFSLIEVKNNYNTYNKKLPEDDRKQGYHNPATKDIDDLINKMQNEFFEEIEKIDKTLPKQKQQQRFVPKRHMANYWKGLKEQAERKLIKAEKDLADAIMSQNRNPSSAVAASRVTTCNAYVNRLRHKVAVYSNKELMCLQAKE